jgi:hypothetical protein
MAFLFNFLFNEGEALGFIKKGIAEGLGTEEILGALAKGGLSIRPELATNVIEYLGKTILPDLDYIKRLQYFAQPNLARIPIALTKTLRNFSYQVSVQGFTKATGELETHNISISTNTLLTKQQAIDMATELAVGESKSGGLESGAGVVTSITQNPAGLVLP